MESNLDWALRYAALGLTPGVDLYTIQKAGGWKTPIMVQRYAHLRADHIRAAVEQLAIRSERGTGTRTGTNRAWREVRRRGSPRQDVVRLAGVEPATLGLEVRRSIQLSYRRIGHLAYITRGADRGRITCGLVPRRPWLRAAQLGRGGGAGARSAYRCLRRLVSPSASTQCRGGCSG
jgi:hypothetical protein